MRIKSQTIYTALKSKFARSIMVPLISIFVLVVAAIIFIVFSSFTSEMKTNEIEKKLQQLRTTEQSISARFNEINRISYHISEDDQFSFTPLTNHKKYSGYELAKALEKLLVGNDFISYLSYYRISEPNKVYSSEGEMLFHTFWKSYVGFEDETEEQYLDYIRSNTNRKVLPAKKSSKGKSYLTMIYPIPLLSNRPSAYAITYINGTELDSIVDSLYADCVGEMLIFDIDEVPIYNYVSSGRESIKDEIIENVSLLSEDKTYRTFTYEDQDYIIFQHQVDNNGWKYVAMIRKDDITGNLTNKQTEFLLVLFSIMLFAIIATIGCVLFNYRDINKLAQSISQDLNISEYKLGNEQVLLSNAFVSLMERTQSITQNLFLANLVTGQYDETTIKSAMNECNMNFEYSHYIACVVYFHGVLDNQTSEGIITNMKEHFDVNDMQCYPLYQSNPNRVLILVNATESMLSWEVFEPILSTLYYKIGEEYNAIISIGVGNIYPSVLKVLDSSNEAVSAMYFCILEGERFIKRFNDIDIDHITSKVSSFTTNLISVVRQGDTEGIHDVMSEMNAILMDNSISLQHQSYVAYGILTTLTEYVDDPAITDEINEVLQTLLKRTQSNNLRIFEQIEGLCINIAEYRNEIRKSNQNKDLINTIISTITNNLCDSMMSLESIADQCGISPSYLSRYFKAQTGQTPMNYVETLRMTLVKEKLCKTDESLKQILIETGYIDQSNFIRKFKKIEGVTPMTYRKACQNNGCE